MFEVMLCDFFLRSKNIDFCIAEFEAVRSCWSKLVEAGIIRLTCFSCKGSA